MIVEPEARLGFWSLAFLVLMHRGKDIPTASEMADVALDEFDSKAEEINNDADPRPA